MFDSVDQACVALKCKGAHTVSGSHPNNGLCRTRLFCCINPSFSFSKRSNLGKLSASQPLCHEQAFSDLIVAVLCCVFYRVCRRRRSEGRRRRFALDVTLQVPAVEWDNSVPAAIERRRCRSEGRRRRSMRVRVVDVAQRAVDVVSLWSSLCKFRLSKRIILFHFPVSWPTVPFDLLLTFVQINL